MSKHIEASHAGELRFGDLVIPCAVLNDGRRVLSARGVGRAFGDRRKKNQVLGDAAKLPVFLTQKAIFGRLPAELVMPLNSPILYQSDKGGVPALCYEAKLLPDICWAISDAADAGELRKNQRHLVVAAKVLLRALTGVGIEALVDDACRVSRQYGELQRRLDEFLSIEARIWAKTFTDSFFSAMARCRPRKMVIGVFINHVVYGRMPVPVLPEFDRLNPRVNGRRKRCNHQHISEDALPVLREHLAVVTKLMEIAHDPTHFEHMLVRAYPKIGDQLLLGIAELPAESVH